MMKVSVIGLGYVGFAIAEASVKAGHQVIGIDIDEKKVSEIQNLLGSQNFKASVNFPEIEDSEVVIICVPTPLDKNRKPDTSLLKSALNSIKPYVNENTLVVNESTSYPGTLRNLIAVKLNNKGLFASAPERVDPASPNWNIKNTPRLVSGMTPEATEKVKSFYQTFCDQVHTTSSPEVAEAAKLLENTFRQVNIALVNEFAQIAEKFGISAHETILAAGTKPFGFMPFMPGIGVGGHCIPVDPSYLSFAVEELGGNADFIDLANKVNLEMPNYVAKRIDKKYKIKNKKIQIAGIAYKPDVSDLRESPALDLIDALRKFGAVVTWHDPLVKKWGEEVTSQMTGEIDLGLIVSPHSVIDFAPWKSAGVPVLDLSATSKQFGWTKYL